MSDRPIVWMTYTEISEARGISRASVSMLVNLLDWPRRGKTAREIEAAVPLADGTVMWMTYDEISKAREVDRVAAQQLVRRNKWPKRLREQAIEIAVPADELRYWRRKKAGPPSV